MHEIDREEWMTAKITRDPTKLDDIEGTAERLIKQFLPTPMDATDSFYNSQGDICAIKNVLEVGPAVSDEQVKSSEKRGDRYRPKLSKDKSEEYRSKSKTKKEKNKRKWVNNKKIRWKDQTKAPSFPSYLLPKSDSLIKGVPTAVAAELQSYLDRAQVQGMEQIGDLVYCDSNSEADDDDEDDDDTFHDVIQVKDAIENTNDNEATIYGEPVNNEFIAPVGQKDGATGVTIYHKGVLYAQYCHAADDCHYGEFYYQLCGIYRDDPAKTEEAIDRMAHSSDIWSLCDDVPSLSLCDNAPSFHLTLCSEMEYNQQVIERNQRLAYQGILDNYKDVGITEAELQKAQIPLKPSNRRPEMMDYERMRKYLGHVPTDIVRRTI